MNIKVTCVEDGLIPKRMRRGDAALDCYVREDVTIEPGEVQLVPLGFKMAIPEEYVGLLSIRSGSALNAGLMVANAPGVIDSNFRGEVQAVVYNRLQDAVTVYRGERIAQLTILPSPSFAVEESDQLDVTIRGEAGFGSSGKF